MQTIVGKALYDLGSVNRLPPGEGRAFQVENTLVTVFRTRAGELFATQALCPHRGGPLADGVIGGGQVICPLHALKFDLATGQPIGNSCEALKTYFVTLSETDNILLVLDEKS